MILRIRNIKHSPVEKDVKPTMSNSEKAQVEKQFKQVAEEVRQHQSALKELVPVMLKLRRQLEKD